MEIKTEKKMTMNLDSDDIKFFDDLLILINQYMIVHSKDFKNTCKDHGISEATFRDNINDFDDYFRRSL